ncbi:MAG TPA: helix-turn-helix domain-containing protein [Solirubrobacterales bacterium]|nr:helix-turn-helix domain-containing protein [Solirubrobacterales bacterium]
MLSHRPHVPVNVLGLAAAAIRAAKCAERFNAFATYPFFCTMSRPLSDDPSKDATLEQATRHPLRLGLLQMLGGRASVTAAEAMDELGGGRTTLRGINYHVWVLGRYALVEPTGELTDRGIPYRLTRRGALALQALGYSIQGGGT